MTAPPDLDLVELQRIADAGDAEAAHALSLRHAAGLGAPHDWAEAIRRMRQAAEAGHALAEATIGLIGAEPDVTAWLTLPRPVVLSPRPHVLTIERFAAPELCAWLIERSRPKLERAAVYDNVSAAQTFEDSRDNSTAAYSFWEADLAMLLIRERIARATGLPVPGLEPLQVLHYAVGQRFEPHYDWLDATRSGHRPDLELAGQRIATFLVYLNEDFEGGATSMLSIGLEHRGATGDALFWANVTPDGKPDLNTLHAGRAPTSGEKWVLSQWCRNRAPRPA